MVRACGEGHAGHGVSMVEAWVIGPCQHGVGVIGEQGCEPVVVAVGFGQEVLI